MSLPLSATLVGSASDAVDSLPAIQLTIPRQPTANAPLVFDGVTVIDVEHGRRIPSQRVVVVGNRIKMMGKSSAVSVAPGARVVNARGKYLIPGLWDMHTHSARKTDIFYPLFLANGVTGIRDAGSQVPLDTIKMWRREILAGTRVGPPRQILSGQSIAGPDTACHRLGGKGNPQTCVSDLADARHYIDSLKTAGADMIKPRAVTKELYFAIASEARRMHIPFGGHIQDERAIDASDSGAKLVDHMDLWLGMDLGEYCWSSGASASLAKCKEISDRFRRNGTWFVPTLIVFYHALPVFLEREETDKAYQWAKRIEEPAIDSVFTHFQTLTEAFWDGTLPHGNWLRDSTSTTSTTGTKSAPALLESSKMRFLIKTGMPIIAGTDVGMGSGLNGVMPGKEMPGFSLLMELAMYGTDGMPADEALRTATLNPAKMLHATDSMGTVAKGKLADLVLLDADPLADITNVTTINAVVANGRYYDRAALNELLKRAQSLNTKKN